MKFINSAISLFLLLSSFQLSAAAPAESLDGLLRKIAQSEVDQAHMLGLRDASSLIGSARLKVFLKGGRDWQLADQARCQFSVSCAFSEILNQKIGLIHDEALKAELVVLAAELTALHRERDAYADPKQTKIYQWDTEETCARNNQKYNDLLTAAPARINDIFNQFQKKCQVEKNLMTELARELIKHRQLEEGLSRDLERILQQRAALISELTVLRTEREDLKGKNAYVEALKKDLDEELARRKSQQATYLREMEDEKAAQQKLLAELEAAKTQKINEVEDFKTNLAHLVREAFCSGAGHEELELASISPENAINNDLKTELRQLLGRLESKFAQSQAGLSMGEERSVQHQLVIQIENITSATDAFKRAKKFLTGTIMAKVSAWNIVKTTRVRPLSFRYYDNGGLLRDKNGDLIKNDDLVAIMEEVISRDIPWLKKEVYEEANSIKNQRMLWGSIGSLLEKSPCSSSSSCHQESGLPLALRRMHRDEAGAAANADEGANNRFCIMCGFEEPFHRGLSLGGSNAN